MKKSELKNIIKEELKNHLSSRLNEKEECGCPGGVGCCYNANHCEEGEYCKALCCVKRKDNKEKNTKQDL